LALARPFSTSRLTPTDVTALATYSPPASGGIKVAKGEAGFDGPSEVYRGVHRDPVALRGSGTRLGRRFGRWCAEQLF